MTVKELIVKLEKCKPYSEIFVNNKLCDNYPIVSLSQIYNNGFTKVVIDIKG